MVLDVLRSNVLVDELFHFYYLMIVFIPKNVFTENIELDINLVTLGFLLFHENILSHVLAVILSAVCAIAAYNSH